MKNEWKAQDTLALFVIPLEMAMGYLLASILSNSGLIVQALLPFFLKLLSLILIVVLYHKLLVEHWKSFTRRLWLKLLICTAAAAAIYFVLSGVRFLAGIAQSSGVLEQVTGGLPYGLFLLAASTPALAPFTEEIVFRHVLFYKFRNSMILRIVMCLVSAFLFGAVHLANFGGDLWLTVPYMVIALLYNLVYYFTKNIWFTITIHFLFNFAQSVIPAILLPFLVMRVS